MPLGKKHGPDEGAKSVRKASSAAAIRESGDVGEAKAGRKASKATAGKGEEGPGHAKGSSIAVSSPASPKASSGKSAAHGVSSKQLAHEGDDDDTEGQPVAKGAATPKGSKGPKQPRSKPGTAQSAKSGVSSEDEYEGEGEGEGEGVVAEGQQAPGSAAPKSVVMGGESNWPHMAGDVQMDDFTATMELRQVRGSIQDPRIQELQKRLLKSQAQPRLKRGGSEHNLHRHHHKKTFHFGKRVTICAYMTVSRSARNAFAE
jgi:hypothetical protein